VQSRIFNKRFIVVSVFLVFFLTLLFIRCFYLQIFQFGRFSKLAKVQQSDTIILEPHRGRIFDANGNVLAANLAVESVYAEPHRIEDFSETAKALCETLDLQEDFVVNRLNQRKFFVWIKRKVEKKK